MKHTSAWLFALVAVTLVGCSDSPTAPPLLTPQPAGTSAAVLNGGKAGGTATCHVAYCVSPECRLQSVDDYCIDLDTYPRVLVVDDAESQALYGDIPLGPAAMSDSYNAGPACEWTVSNNYGNGLANPPTSTTIDKAPSCPDLPCYGEYLEARAAERMKKAGGVVGGIATAATFLSPEGYAVKVVKASGWFVGSVGFVGWANHSMVQAKNQKLKVCMAQGEFYHQTIIY